MYFKYGSHRHVENEASVSSHTIRAIFDSRLERRLHRETISISGRLLPTAAPGTTAVNQDNIKALIVALKDAYSRDGQGDAGLYHDDGSPSPHILYNGQALGGVRILSVSFPSGGPGEYATNRSYSITIEADYLPSGSQDDVVMFRETLTVTGNGLSKDVVLPVLSGPPIFQTTQQQTVISATQQGRAIGYRSHPGFPAPLFGSKYLINESKELGTESPRHAGNALLDFPTSWKYDFHGLPRSAGPGVVHAF